jgi:glycosyltransferase involved in cell wall biosynthesis
MVATSVGGNVEVIVPEETGLLVEPRDPAALAAAMARLAGSRELRERFGQAARRRVEMMFAVPPMVASTQRLYRSLLASHQRAAA